MKTLLALSLVGACGAVSAQTPTANPMPDGSRDAYVGLGVVSAPDYLGARQRGVSAIPLIQLETSNGLFISGLSAGMHIATNPGVEFGPLLALDPGRDTSGDRRRGGGVTDPVQGFGVRPGELTLASPDSRAALGAPHELDGLPNIKARLQGGFFTHVYLASNVRVGGTLLIGAGNDRDGAIATLSVQRLSGEPAPHHKVTLSAGLTVVNRSHNENYFGVTDEQATSSGYAAYAPRAGVRDVYVGAGWNWALSPSWIVTSAARVSVLTGDARHSPLVRRPTSVTISTGLAYRF
jgi:MipA family protein